MRVCMLLEDPYPPDIRVTKEAGALLDRDHEVTLVCGRRENEPSRERVDGIDVRRVRLQDSYRGAAGVWRGAVYLSTFVQPVLRRELERVVDDVGADVIHAHDLPMVKTALSVGDASNVAVVADLHENWPEAVRQYRTKHGIERYVREPRYVFERTALSVRRLKRFERDCVDRADRVIAVVEEGKRHYVAKCGAAPEAVTVVSNVVDLSAFDTGRIDPRENTDEFVISYVGTLSGDHRGLKEVLRAMPAVIDRVSDPRLVIVGSGGGYGEVLRDLRDELDIEDHVTFTGWVDFEDVPSYIAASDVCLVPHRASPHTETTVPHKLFQYMAMGKPVIVTNVAPLRRIVSETDAGIVVEAGDSAAMADAAIELAERPTLAAELGKNGRRAVESKYNWEHEAEKLAELYRTLSAKGSHRRKATAK